MGIKLMKNKPLVALCIGLAVSIFVTHLFVSGKMLSWHYKFANILYQNNNITASDNIVIIAIDDKSLQSRLGRWQEWRRSYYADLVDTLSEQGAKVIGIDVNFSEISKIENDDRDLARSLKKSTNVILTAESQTQATLIPNETLFDVINNSDASFGFVNTITDQDNIVRKIRMSYNDGNISGEHFAVQIIRRYLDIEDKYNSENINANYVGDKYVIMSGKDMDEEINEISSTNIPLSRGNFMINFFGQPGAYSRISFIDILDGNFIDQNKKIINLDGKIVLVGATAADLHDDFFTPVSSGRAMPGVEIHANIINTILEQKYLIQQSHLSKLISISMTSIMTALVSVFVGITTGAIIVSIMIFGYIVSAAVLFANQGIIIDMTYFFIAIISSWILTFIYRYVSEEREKKHLRDAFSKYVNKNLVGKILEHPESLALGGQKKKLSIFFSDIAGFTTLSEKLNPEELVQMLNEYLGEMTDIIMRSDGTVDKYIGDAIMAFWGAPLDDEQHAVKACHAALDNLEALDRLRAKWKKEGKMNIYARIGINTGDVVVGNMGSSMRFNYTVMGDAVNLASRLEAANKEYKTLIMIGHETYKLIKDDFDTRELDLLIVKGKTKPVRVHHLLAIKGKMSEKMKDALPHYEKGFELYRAQKWEDSKKEFDEVIKIIPGDGPSSVYLDRIKTLSANPPGIDWDGVWVMTSK